MLKIIFLFSGLTIMSVHASLHAYWLFSSFYDLNQIIHAGARGFTKKILSCGLSTPKSCKVSNTFWVEVPVKNIMDVHFGLRSLFRNIKMVLPFLLARAEPYMPKEDVPYLPNNIPCKWPTYKDDSYLHHKTHAHNAKSCKSWLWDSIGEER